MKKLIAIALMLFVPAAFTFADAKPPKNKNKTTVHAKGHHKGGKKSKKNSGGTTTPPPKVMGTKKPGS